VTAPSCREMAPDLPLAATRGGGYSRSQRPVEPCRARFRASANRSIRRPPRGAIRAREGSSVFAKYRLQQKSRLAFVVNQRFNYNA
jgi:hypothetical protein